MPKRIVTVPARKLAGDWNTDGHLVTVFLIVAVFSVFILSGFSLHRVIEQGNQTHAALCAYKADVEQRADNSERFLLMTPEQRAAKYGKQLARIPEATIRKSLSDQRSVLEALSYLDC